LHCNKEITKTIIESKNDYLITVKRNQIKLHNRLKELAQITEVLNVKKSLIKIAQNMLNFGRRIKIF